MSRVSATAPGKVILLGEHSVVYGQPALAVPVSNVVARATLETSAAGVGLRFDARDIGESFLASAAPDSPLSHMARMTCDFLSKQSPDAVAIINSTIPVAGGLGSGAAVSAALGRVLARWFGQEIGPDDLSALVYEVEKLHHGTPSGIDNTVICHGRPVFFVRGNQPELVHVKDSFHLVIADTGIASATKAMVEGVRGRWMDDQQRFDSIFAAVGEIVRHARTAIESGDVALLGPLMDQNQQLLDEMGVSSRELNRLVAAARNAGASGAKLSGGGGGGNMIALAKPDHIDAIRSALLSAGARRAIHTIVHTTRA